MDIENTVTTEPSDSVGSYSLSTAVSDIGASNQIYNGSGVRVGILEAGGVANSYNNSELSNVNIHTNGENSTSTHAINVTRILCGSNGVARGIEAAYIYGYDTTDDVIPAMNWFIDNGCNVINNSWGIKSTNTLGTYHWLSAFFDYNVRYNGVTIVKSAGNNGNQSNHFVTPPSTGYNVIAVGNSTVNKSIVNSSAYGESSLNQRKPTLSAPGTNIYSNGESIGTGTSFSAPMVTGVIAKLMQQYPILKTYPQIVQAVLIVSSTPALGQNGWDDVAGAGIVNYSQAQSAMSKYQLITNSSNQVGKMISKITTRVTSGQRITIAFVWFANSNTTSNPGSTQANIHTDYNLQIKNSSGSIIAVSDGLTNIEYLSFINNNFSTMQLVINQVALKLVNATDVGAVAWY